VRIKTRYIVLFLLIYSNVQSQSLNQHNKIKITGIIYDAQTSERVPFAHIIDVKNNKGTSADDNGNFSFHCSLNDSIKFTAIGYEDFYLVVGDSHKSESFITVQLKPKSYLLEALDFYANDPMKGFYLKDIERDTIRLGSKGMPEPGYWNASPTGGSGYISAFANLFNRHHKQEKKLRKILEEEERYNLQKEAEENLKKLLEEKYNLDLVSYITDLEGEELEEFIKKYKPSDLFILRSTRYEIAVQIVNSFREYRFENGLEVDVSEILERAKFKD
jgi:hypothetical protein